VREEFVAFLVCLDSLELRERKAPRDLHLHQPCLDPRVSLVSLDLMEYLGHLDEKENLEFMVETAQEEDLVNLEILVWMVSKVSLEIVEHLVCLELMEDLETKAPEGMMDALDSLEDVGNQHLLGPVEPLEILVPRVWMDSLEIRGSQAWMG
jgi:hypothetical protein